ncbi:MAG TPA: class I SAM-dependent methyltransferase [Streptosporangiaceae bacterium]|jgi:SAM-dependent methyltransferase|nr:class I SAM-dependent methyltransferase [Streptosporangiaceae bacterium]
MSSFYKIAYQVGFHPWEDLADHPPFADTLTRLIAREEGGGGPPFGRALDVGSGSGVWGVRLAQRGWDVTGVELVAKAVERARKRAAASSVPMRIVRADVTKLRASDVGTGFRLILDTGTFHGLTEPQRTAMGREITAVAAADATVLLDVFAPRRRGPLPHGATPSDIEAAFPAWQITDVEVADTDPEPIALKLKFDEHWYRLRRK